MADSASTELKIRLMEDGVTSSWGDKVDTNMQIIEHALTGSATASLAGGDWTLADVDYTEDDGKASILIATGSLGANRNIVIPNKKKYWIVKNDTTGSYTVTVKTASGTGKTVTQSTVATFWCDGADAVYHVVPMVNATTGAPSSASGAAASSVSFTPAGTITSTNVQAAIAELDADVAANTAALAGYQPLDSDLTTIAGLDKADGNIIVGDGAGWTVESGATARASLGVVIGTDVQAYDAFLADIAVLSNPGADRLLFWDNSAVAIRWLTVTDGLVLTTDILKAKFVQATSTSYDTYTSTTTTIPTDDTIPQNTEGAEIMTVSITPKATSNKLRIEVNVHCACNPAANAQVALFQDSTANALAARWISAPVNSGVIISFTHVMDAGTTSSTTFKVRAGPSANTMYFNGNSAGRLLGGVQASTLTVTEYTP